MEGICKIGTLVYTNDKLKLGRIMSIQKNNKPIDNCKMGDEICMEDN